MDFIEGVGTRYLEGKAYAAPQKLENYAKKQFKSSREPNEKTKSRKGSQPSIGSEDEEESGGETLRKTSSKSSTKQRGGGISEKDLEIARLRGELEEARRARSSGTEIHGPSKKERASKKYDELPSHGGEGRKSSKPSSTRALETRGFKVVGGALVADAGSRRHREKRPEHSKAKSLGRTVDNKGLSIAKGALVTQKRSGRANSKSRYAAKEPIIVEAAPRSRRRLESNREDSAEESSAEEEDMRSERAAHSTPDRRQRRRVADSSPSSEDDYSEEEEEEKYETATLASSTQRSSKPRSLSNATNASTPPTTFRTLVPSTAPSKSSLSHHPRRPSTSSDHGSLIASPAQIRAVHRRQRSRGRGLADAEIDTAAPETPSLRALSRRRRQLREDEEEEEGAEERGGGRGRHEFGRGGAHLPVRSRSVVREAVGGEGSVVDVLEVDSVGFRPRREGVGGKRGGGRGVEVRNERDRGSGGMVVRRSEGSERPSRADNEVELVRKEGGRSVYRVR